MYGNFVHATNDASHNTKPPRERKRERERGREREMKADLWVTGSTLLAGSGLVGSRVCVTNPQFDPVFEFYYAYSSQYA